LVFALVGCFLTPAAACEPVLIGHWPLQGDARDHSEANLPTMSRGVDFEVAGPSGLPRSAARFRRKAVIEVSPTPTLQLGKGEFSISLWVRAEEDGGESPCDLISHYDANTQTGFHLGVYSHGGVTNAQPNSRQLHFGIDQGRIEEQFLNHGRLGNAVFVFALCVHDGRLYAATCHAGQDEAGHVFRYGEGDRWTDLGAPDRANAISALVVYNGSLYAGSSKYRLAGSALSESQNPNLGGKVFRLDGDRWVSCGELSPETEAVASLVVFRGRLYASSLYRPAGFFRYEGGENWIDCPTPEGKRIEAMTVFRDALYATSYDEGSVFRYDGQAWEHVGTIPGATQTYGLAVHRGELYVSEWPQAHVYRYAGGTNWLDAGKLGNELEAMPLLVYNGKLYGGTLPSAEVYRYDGPTEWTRIGQVDNTPDVKYRRAWSMAVHRGRLFVGALPSGRVLSLEAGRNSTWDYAFPTEWRHVAAVRDSDRLRLYVDGQVVAESALFAGGSFDLSNSQPLRIGFGAQDFFQGDLADIRLYRGALTPDQVRELSQR
jgi:hypothetical protein